MHKLVARLIHRRLLPVLGLALGLALGGAALTAPSAHAQDNSTGFWGEDCILSNGLMLPEGLETNDGLFRVRCENGRLVIVGVATLTGNRPSARPFVPASTVGATLAR